MTTRRKAPEVTADTTFHIPHHGLPNPNRAISIAEFCNWLGMERTAFYQASRKPGIMPRRTKVTNERMVRILPQDFIEWYERVRAESAESQEPERKVG